MCLRILIDGIFCARRGEGQMPLNRGRGCMVFAFLEEHSRHQNQFLWNLENKINMQGVGFTSNYTYIPDIIKVLVKNYLNYIATFILDLSMTIKHHHNRIIRNDVISNPSLISLIVCWGFVGKPKLIFHYTVIIRAYVKSWLNLISTRLKPLFAFYCPENWNNQSLCTRSSWNCLDDCPCEILISFAF